ncbi:7155_t:CDS:2, partial [Acaulospora morrowiae]
EDDDDYPADPDNDDDDVAETPCDDDDDTVTTQLKLRSTVSEDGGGDVIDDALRTDTASGSVFGRSVIRSITTMIVMSIPKPL